MYRACQLARRAFEALPATRGCVGLDLVLGDDPAGSQDVVIEVNPRLTTSYLGLRQATTVNLAAAMLAIQQGGRSPLFFQPNTVEFEADGRTRAS
jgi:predicted ATP-grasp superfamily ATP-dependent carboligase